MLPLLLAALAVAAPTRDATRGSHLGVTVGGGIGADMFRDAEPADDDPDAKPALGWGTDARVAVMVPGLVRTNGVAFGVAWQRGWSQLAGPTHQVPTGRGLVGSTRPASADYTLVTQSVLAVAEWAIDGRPRRDIGFTGVARVGVGYAWGDLHTDATDGREDSTVRGGVLDVTLGPGVRLSPAVRLRATIAAPHLQLLGARRAAALPYRDDGSVTVFSPFPVGGEVAIGL